LYLTSLRTEEAGQHAGKALGRSKPGMVNTLLMRSWPFVAKRLD
jgi:hypothetical protein